MKNWKDNDIDAAYFIGFMNCADGEIMKKLGSEVDRLKKIGKNPHEFISDLRNKEEFDITELYHQFIDHDGLPEVFQHGMLSFINELKIKMYGN